MFVWHIILILSLTRTEAQFHLYRTDPVSETDLYYACLHYKVLDNFGFNDDYGGSRRSPYQIIPYCMRPLTEKERQGTIMMRGNISSNFTFDELRKLNVRAQDLLLWSAPIDVVERYENNVNIPKSISSSETFYNCTSLWFGPFCQYTFNSNQSFSEILRETFMGKEMNGRDNLMITDITNLTCYVHLECNRGPPPICLDWREICDGKIDCLGDGIDEMNCFELETNECEEKEYRCHNGMCVPGEFFNDNSFNPDCLDRTDENNDESLEIVRTMGFYQCFQDPAFRCEESDQFLSYRGFVCGDGQQIHLQVPDKLMDLPVPVLSKCENSRNYILLQSGISDALQYPNLTSECSELMTCLMFQKSGYSCTKDVCAGQSFPCSVLISEACNQSIYVIFPVLPILRAYAQFGYWTNRTILYDSSEEIPLPDFVAMICNDVLFFHCISRFRI